MAPRVMSVKGEQKLLFALQWVCTSWIWDHVLRGGTHYRQVPLPLLCKMQSICQQFSEMVLMDLWGQLNLLFITGKNGRGLGYSELKLCLQCQNIPTELYCIGQTEYLLHYGYWNSESRSCKVTLTCISKDRNFYFFIESKFCNMVKWAQENDK